MVERPCSRDFIHKDELLRKAILENNGSAYKEYERCVKDQEERSFIQRQFRAILLLAFTGWLVSDANSPGLAEFVLNYAERLSWFPSTLIALLWALVAAPVFLLSFSNRRDRELYDYVLGVVA